MAPTICRRLPVLVASLLLFAHAGAAATPGKVTKETFDFNGRAVTYYLFVPKSATPAAPAPMLLLLHGSGRNGSTLVEPWKGLAEKEGIVLVGPDASDPQQWRLPQDGPEGLCALMETLRKTLPVDSRRIYLFGHSAGAVYALYLSILESEFFAATAIHAGALRTPDEYLYLPAMTRAIPVAITVGDRDAFFPVDAVHKTAAAFKARGAPVVTEIVAGHDHNYYVTASKVNAWAWAFLKDRRLDADPRYTQHDIR